MVTILIVSNYKQKAYALNKKCNFVFVVSLSKVIKVETDNTNRSPANLTFEMERITLSQDNAQLRQMSQT